MRPCARLLLVLTVSIVHCRALIGLPDSPTEYQRRESYNNKEMRSDLFFYIAVIYLNLFVPTKDISSSKNAAAHLSDAFHGG